MRSRVLRAVLTRDLLEINRPGEAQGHVLPSSEEGNPGLHEGKKWEQTESLIALLIGYKRKPQGGTLAATISEQRRSPHADRHVLRTGHRLSDFHLHLAAQEAMCSLAAVPQKGLAHHCAVSPAHHWAAWEETGAPKLGGVWLGGSGADGGHRGNPESHRGFLVIISLCHHLTPITELPWILRLWVMGTHAHIYSLVPQKTFLSCASVLCLLKARIMVNR